ncbi:MAG: hypothetical protein IPG10_10520 [Flavobacteriales bacterium]|jgi:hypothetical protein|nr:hypothetical protein [Flavobacteriales bacterium]MBK6753537.1 hypothetical protein [Flavobacteriales bacterium]MBK7269897.1 hypothetical protein [Flavobacteriales bacterium]MBK7753488.1 hypothetical protein [Flavobacteriales bacterium]MBK9077072.1 hypothetical protein [Flavobacteriales bacterium]
MSRRALLNLFLLLAHLAPAQIDTSVFRDPVKGKLKLRAIGGILGLSLENHGAQGVETFQEYAKTQLPLLPGKPSDYYFNYSATAIGFCIGPRFALARTIDGHSGENGWTFHLNLHPRIFYLYLYTDSLLGDTARKVEYLYTMSQTEIAVGGGPYWSLFLGRRAFLRGGLLAELGHASGGTLSVQGVATDEVGGFSNERTLVDRSLQGRACTYLRGYLSAQLGVRLGKRTDLSAQVQYGTGFMWLHGVDVRSLMSSTLYALNLQFLVTR